MAAAKRAEVAEPVADAEPVEAPSVEAFPAGGCGWALELKDKTRVPCTSGEMHAGEHSFTEQAIKSGGRVVRSGD